MTGDESAAEFYDVHVETAAEHQVIAANDLAAGLARDEPDLAAGEALSAAGRPCALSAARTGTRPATSPQGGTHAV